MSEQQHAAGWYPAPGDPTRERYWDGSAWTDRYRGQGSDSAMGEASAAPTASGATPFYKKRWVQVVAGLIVVVAIFSGGGGDSDGEDSGGGSAAPAAPEPPPVDPDSLVPRMQEEFVDIALQAREDFFDAATDLQEAEIYRVRDDALCAVLGSEFVAEGWVGEISSIGANGDGDAFVEIEIADDVEVGTFNNVLSDLMHSTLIDRGTDMHTTLLGMERGDKVFFSGLFIDGSETCMYNKRLTEDGSLRDPSFLMRFWDIQPFTTDGYTAPPQPESSRSSSGSSAGSGSSDSAAAAPPAGSATTTEAGFDWAAVSFGCDAVDDVEARARLTNTGNDISLASFTMTVLQGGQIAATLSATVSDLAAGMTKTVEFISLDDCISGTFDYEIQSDSVLRGTAERWDDQFSWDAVSFGCDFVDDVEARGRVTNSGDEVSFASFLITIFDGEEIAATLSGTVSDLGTGATKTVEFISLDDCIADVGTYEIQVESAF